MLFRLWLAAVGRAAAFALARVFALATVVASLAATLSFTIILAFARVFALFSFQGLDGNACLGRSAAGGIGASCSRPGEKTGDSCTGTTAFDGMIIADFFGSIFGFGFN